jgi:hypothetical protein
MAGVYESLGANPVAGIEASGIFDTVRAMRIAKMDAGINFNYIRVNVAEFGKEANLDGFMSSATAITLGQFLVHKDNLAAMNAYKRGSLDIAGLMVYDSASGKFKMTDNSSNFDSNFKTNSPTLGGVYTIYDANMYDIYDAANKDDYSGLKTYETAMEFRAANPDRSWNNQAEINSMPAY